ncbi:MAG: diadenylate cyclase CdaA [Lachnospiraceae bacterium]|nr:diadenylate cyclase CdaA [Lachnospiraceae bacterium]
MQNAFNFIQHNLLELHMPAFQWSDALEILVIAFLIYHILRWLRNTRAWTMMRGLAVVGALIVVAALFGMTTILWIVQNVMQIAVIALIIILQPELRSAIEELGQKDLLSSLFRIDTRRQTVERFSDKTVNEIVRASVQMAKACTGALIVIEQTTPLNEIERTGIAVDGLVTSQLLVNIFEKNTPLHDGAVIVRGDRVVSATCYLPLSETRMDKELGTRHRAGVGVSEVSDALTIIISEENGKISLAYRGALTRNVDADHLRARLVTLQKKEAAAAGRRSLLDRLLYTDRRGRDGE